MTISRCTGHRATVPASPMRTIHPFAAALAPVLVACASVPPASGTDADLSMVVDASVTDGSPADTAEFDADAGSILDSASPDVVADATPDGGCAVFGAPGECVTVSACVSRANHSAYAGHCPGAADIQCCIRTPDTADNPPLPTGYRLMTQAEVTSPMTTWAVAILNGTTTYPMFATTTMMFGAQLVLARVEWHPPDFQNSAVHRGVTLYVPV